MLSFKQVNNDLSAKQIIQPIVSLGFPTRLYRSKSSWVVKMSSVEAAKDAVYILNKHIHRLYPFMGDSVTVNYIDTLPENEHFVSKKIEGRAEN